jgi:hypothetical protein
MEDGSFDASLLEASNFWIAVFASEKSTSLTHHAIDSLPRSQRELIITRPNNLRFQYCTILYELVPYVQPVSKNLSTWHRESTYPKHYPYLWTLSRLPYRC